MRYLMFTMLTMTFASPVFALDIFGDDTLWESGENLYIKFEKQGKYPDGNRIPNDHPVKLDSESISNALLMLEYTDREKDTNTVDTNRVFTISQARLLGNYLSTGLARAEPEQDIVFTLAAHKAIALGILKEKAFMAGRAFYKDNHLHVIIGDYDRPVDKGKEAAAGGAGITEVKYFFNEGERDSPSSFKKNVITGNGIELKLDGKRKRRDWFVIDVPLASQAYVARAEERKKGNQGINTEAIEAESARLAKERREMRMEMARMRKEMQELSDGNAGTSTKTIEERMAVLDELLEKNLISKEEYEKKRKEILDEI